MKLFHKTLCLLSLTQCLGCYEGTSGGPGVPSDAKTKNSALGRADDTFNLTVPILLTSVQQGDQVKATIGINRAKNFDSDVALEFKNLPAGVTILPERPIIKHGDKESEFSISAAESAVNGEFKLEVLGHPNIGADAKIDLRMSVTPKDSFSLNTPLLSTSLKQGESELISIKVHRDKRFMQDVTLTLIDLPAGITTEPESIVNRNGESNTEFRLVAASDAALGRFAVKLNGHPASGIDSSKEFHFVVSKDE